MESKTDSNDKGLSIIFAFEKATPNTYRFKEKPAVGAAPIIGNLYVQQWVFDEVGDGDEVHLTVKLVKRGVK